MSDPSTYWLTFTNIGLGVVTLICCLAVAFGVVQELAAKRKKKAALAALDHEVSGLVASYGDGHAFDIPAAWPDHGRWRRADEKKHGKERAVAAMTCPFLREAQVKYCRASSVRKLIPLAQRRAARTRSVPRPLTRLPGLSAAHAAEGRPADRARSCANR